MKKLMVMALALSAAVATQAAMVDWSYTISDVLGYASKTEAQAGTYASGYTAYLFAAADFDAATFAKADLADKLDSSAIQFAAFKSVGGKKASYATGNVNVSDKRAVEVTGAAGDPFSAIIVLVDENADKWTYSSVNMIQRGEAEGAGDSGAFAITDADLTAATWTSFQTVPEPTSGLLLILGVAGLALKRKRA